jgi:hypothetical protein
VMVRVVATMRPVPGVTIHVLILTPMSAALMHPRIGVRVGVLVRVTRAALGTAIDCAVRNGIGQCTGLLGLKAMHRC